MALPGFFRPEVLTSRPLKWHRAPREGGPLAVSPRLVTKTEILKRFCVLENESIFVKKLSFFLHKN